MTRFEFVGRLRIGIEVFTVFIENIDVRFFTSWEKASAFSAIALSSLSSCMKDDLTNCPAPKVSLKFDYTYNVENADAFSQEVKNLNVYVFDKNGKYFDTYTQSADKFEQFGLVHGIGEFKKKKYGEIFLKEINKEPRMFE